MYLFKTFEIETMRELLKWIKTSVPFRAELKSQIFSRIGFAILLYLVPLETETKQEKWYDINKSKRDTSHV